MIKNPPLENNMDMGEAGEASCTASQRSGKTTHVSFIVATELWRFNKNGKELRNKTRGQ
jgi:hypothetical protein